MYPKVHHIHPSLKTMLPLYRLIRDSLAGESRIKERGEIYLPHPSTDKHADDRKERYDSYIQRAVYYNVTRRTLKGLIGQVFIKNPVIEVPEKLKAVVEDASGSGVPIAQESKKALSLALSYSRAGLFVDYPAVEGAVTKKRLEESGMRPTIYTYNPQEIVNWRIVERGSEDVLSLVALYETYGFNDDGFEIKSAEQYRVLRLDEDGYYYQEVWREEEPSEEMRTSPYDNRREGFTGGYVRNPKWIVHDVFYPTNAKGEKFRTIPFTFIGSENNDPSPDYPNFYDLASLNIAHYRNSADYEETVFLSGQPTMVIGGLTDEWYTDTLGGEIRFGSRACVPLPEKGTAKLLQATADTPALAAMEHKERQMIALGAKLVEQRKTERTAFEVKLEATADGSVLSNTANNVSAAFEWALGVCADFVGVESTGIKFSLNIEYDLVRMTSDDLQQLLLLWEGGAIGFEELRIKLKEGGLAFLEDALVTTEAQNKKKLQIQMQREQFSADNAGNKDESGDESGDEKPEKKEGE